MKIAVMQMQAQAGDVAANMAMIAKAAETAAGQGAQLLVAPELALTGYGAREAIRDLAEPRDGPSIEALTRLAQRLDIAIVAGFAERAGDEIFNSAVLVQGAVPQVYRKTNLYGGYERALFVPGAQEPVLARIGGLRVGVLICYDVEFPENVRRLALAGADLVVVPTALPRGASSTFVANRMIPVRAFENQLFIAYADHCGEDARFAYEGRSHIVAPDGSTLAQAGAQDPDLLLARIVPQDFSASFAENTYLRDRRD